MNITFFGAFAGGLISTLTPCVYPLIPITLSILGAGPENSRPRAFLRAFLYSLGIFISYCALGMLAIFSGGFFGEIWASTLFRIALGLILIFLALYTAGLFRLKSEGFFSQLASRVSSSNTYGPFAIGAVSGILAAPCTGPLLAAILAFAAINPDKTAGLLLFIFYALGFSLPFLLLALFPKLLKSIPRSGSWLYAVKFIIAIFLFAIGCKYLLSNLDSSMLPLGILSANITLVIALILILICVKYSIRAAQEERDSLHLSCLVIASVCLLPFLFRIEKLPKLQVKQLSSLSQIADKARRLHHPIVMNFTAQWCTQCQEIETTVLEQAEVKNRLAGFEFVKQDLTDLSDQEKELQQQFSIRGLPAIVFLCPSLREMPIERINEVVTPEEFIARLDAAKSVFSKCR